MNLSINAIFYKPHINTQHKISRDLEVCNKRDILVCVFAWTLLIFGGYDVELDWKFTVLGSSEYSRYPAYDTIQRRPFLLKGVGKPCMCTSQCCGCSPFRLICFLQFTTLLYTVPHLGSDACLHFAKCTVQSRRICRKYFPLRTTLLTSWSQERNPVAKSSECLNLGSSCSPVMRYCSESKRWEKKVL